MILQCVNNIEHEIKLNIYAGRHGGNFSYTFMILYMKTVTRKIMLLMLGGRGSQFDCPCSFSKIVSSKQKVKPWFFVTFKIIIRHIFPENLTEIPQVVQKLWRIFLSILTFFINFYQFFGFFDISLLQRN